MWQERRQRNTIKDIKENKLQVQGMEKRHQKKWKGPIIELSDMKQPIRNPEGSVSTETQKEHLKKDTKWLQIGLQNGYKPINRRVVFPFGRKASKLLESAVVI